MDPPSASPPLGLEAPPPPDPHPSEHPQLDPPDLDSTADFPPLPSPTPLPPAAPTDPDPLALGLIPDILATVLRNQQEQLAILASLAPAPAEIASLSASVEALETSNATLIRQVNLVITQLTTISSIVSARILPGFSFAPPPPLNGPTPPVTAPLDSPSGLDSSAGDDAASSVDSEPSGDGDSPPSATPSVAPTPVPGHLPDPPAGIRPAVQFPRPASHLASSDACLPDPPAGRCLSSSDYSAGCSASPQLPSSDTALPPASLMRSLAPSRFSGTRDDNSDIRGWLLQVEQYFHMCQVDRRSFVPCATMLLCNVALSWYRQHKVTIDTMVWSEFSSAITKAFAPVDESFSARSQLANLSSQKLSVPQVIQKFTTTLPLIHDISEPEKIFLFAQALPPHVRSHILTSQPTSLEDAQYLANVAAAAFSHQQHHPRPPPRSFSYANAISSPAGHGAPSPLPSVAPVTSSSPLRFPPKLTDEERERLRQQNACFRCRQPGHTARYCTAFPDSPPQAGNGRQ